MILIEAIMILLLITTIFFCLKLGKQIYVLKSSKLELAKLFNEFQKTIYNADNLMQQLHQLTNESADLINKELANKISTANGITKEISNLIKKADTVGQQLDDKLEESLEVKKQFNNIISELRTKIQKPNHSSQINNNLYLTKSNNIREINSPKSIYELKTQLENKPNNNGFSNDKEQAIADLLKRISLAQKNKQNVE